MTEQDGTAEHATRPTAGAPGGPDAVDWDLAVATARRLSGPGPVVAPDVARGAVADLHRFAGEAEAHVREFTGLDAQHHRAPVVVVDRAGWAQANADGLRELLEPLVAKLRDRHGGALGNPVAEVVGPKITGLETGAMLAFLGSKVLGQFDPYYDGPADGADAGPSGGRLLLVAPNIVNAERELGVDPRDFRFWVCLHEETHRVQFTAVPWLREHLRHEIATLLGATELDLAALLSRARAVVEAVVGAVRSGGAPGPSLIDLVQTPEQRVVLDRITAVMSLLEGHADVVMDDIGPDVVPSVADIRRRFQARRGGQAGPDRVLRRLLGLDAKTRQYHDGARFVRGVVDRVGMQRFNAVWASPGHLPTPAEVADPGAWVARVHA